MQEREIKTVVVTGVSSGIGRSAASALLNNGWRVFGSVRNRVDATALKAEFGEAFTPLLMDIQDNDAILAAADKVRSQLSGRTLDSLVNNAGSCSPNPLLVQSVGEFREQIEVNLVAMFATTRAFAPLLGADPALTGSKGRIVNVSSVMGRIGLPFVGAYAAAKHGVEGLSESLRRELQLFGIDVIIVAPGSTATPIWDKAEALCVNHLTGTIWDRPFRAFRDYMIKTGRKGLAPERVADVIVTALTAPKPSARYAVIKGRFLNWTLPAMLPSRLVDRLVGCQFGLLPKPYRFDRGRPSGLRGAGSR